MKKFYILTILAFFTFFAAQAQPALAAAAPPSRNSTDVVSIYGNVYTNVDSTDFYPNWGQTTLIEEFYVGTDTMIKYSNFNYEGIQLKNPINVSNMTNLHIDFWSANCTTFDVFLINTTPGTVEQKVSLTPTLAGWNSFNIDLSLYTNIALHNIGQIKLVSTPFGGTPGPTVYLDNIYFWKSATTPTIPSFTMASKPVGSAAFSIATPTSNSLGTFTYTSSNPAVATVTGTTVTVLSVGYTYITAKQSAAGAYTAGSASTTFFVTTGLSAMPATAAPMPTKLQANVISLFSNAYANKTVDTWSAGWDQADVTDVQIAGNDTKKYNNLVFAGVEFTAPTIDVTNAQFYHIDVWTPNATSFNVKLVDFGANGTYAGGDDTEYEYTCTPPAYSTWVSYDIPMSAFIGLTTKAHLAQMLFVSSTSTVYIDNVYFWSTGVLDTKLSKFTAVKKENTTILNWATATETNNKGFAVERSKNGTNWEQINFIKSIGTSANNTEYNAKDINPNKGINYYRLKMIDNDGKFSYSSTQSILFSDKENAGFTIYPNPAKSFIGLNVEKLNGNGQIIMTDLLGKTVKTITINNQQTNYKLDVSNLNKGTYFLTLVNGEKVATSKVVVE